MRVCIPVAIFPPEIGGPATYVSELAKRLALRGHEVHIVTFGTPKYEEKNGYFIHRQPYPTLPKIFAFPIRILKAGLLCAQVVKKYNLQLIYAQEYFSGLVGLIAKKLTGKPMYFKYVGDWAWEVAFSRGWTNKFLQDFYDSVRPNVYISIIMFLQKLVGKNCRKIITPSNFNKSIIEKWNIKTPIEVIPNAIEIYPCDKDKYRKELNLSGIIILSIGRLLSLKGFHLVIEAIKSLDRETRYLIIGEGPYRKNLEELIRKLNLKNVYLLGRMPRKEVFRYLCASDLFVLPSYHEGMSHVILEAMSCKTPVLASDIPPNRELIKEGETGFLVSLDSRDIKQKISDILNREDLNTITEKAYVMVREKNSWENHIAALENIMEGE